MEVIGSLDANNLWGFLVFVGGSYYLLVGGSTCVTIHESHHSVGYIMFNLFVIYVFCRQVPLFQKKKKNKVITTMVIGPLDGHTYCPRSAFTHVLY